MENNEDEVQLVVEELPPVAEKLRYKCDVCEMDFYKRWYSPAQNARALEGHLKRHSHKHNVERREMGLRPEKLYNITTANKQLGELVERLGSRLEDLEALIRTQTHRLQSLESSAAGSVRSWAEATARDDSSVAATELSNVSSLPHQPQPDTAWAHFRETTRLGPPPLTDLAECSDACSEDTTTTDITEAEYRPSHQTANRRGYGQAYNQPQNQRFLELSSESESSRFGRAQLSRSHAFRPTESETTAVYSYDGNNYAVMTQVSNMLERLIVWIKQHYNGSKLTNNLQYIHKTQSALNLQIRQRLNQEPRDAEDTELLLDRLYSVMEYEWEP
jgi:hypothetical protein